MERDRLQKITEVIKGSTDQWVSIGEKTPSVSVLEIARKAKVAPQVVYKEIEAGKVSTSYNGQTATFSVTESDKSYFKRAIKTSEYRSRAPGGGPVVKRRVLDKSFERKLAEEKIKRSRISLLPNPEALLEQEKANKELSLIEKAVEVVQNFDKLPDNKDKPLISEEVVRQLENSGRLTFLVFTCPKYNPTALLTEKPEEYIPNQSVEPDLFTPRIKKIRNLKNELENIGINTDIVVLVGNSDPQAYVLPVLEGKGISFNQAEVSQRIKMYDKDFTLRVEKELGKNTTVFSLTETEKQLGSGFQSPTISNIQRDREYKFLKWLFSIKGPYKGVVDLTDDELNFMITKKFEQYGKQGLLVEALGAILLQTETPWILRTEMLKCLGANFPTIYPWIRSEELGENGSVLIK